MLLATEIRLAIVTRPPRMSMTSWMSATDCSNCASSRRAAGRKVWPIAVGATVRVVRSISRAPSASSSFFSRWVSADWVRCSSRAAFTKLPSSTTFTKTSISFRPNSVRMLSFPYVKNSQYF